MRKTAVLMVLVVETAWARPASAQTIKLGDPIPTKVAVVQNGARVDINADCTYDDDIGLDVGEGLHMYGGATLLASATPGGPLLATVPMPPQVVGSDDTWCPNLRVPGPPPGTYYVLYVFGFTNHTTAPASAWQPMVVPARCNGRPLPPVNASGLPLIVGSQVTLGFAGNAAGCSINAIDLEIGTTPGGKEIGVFRLPGFGAVFPSVPAGTYYTRARGVNASGSSQPSLEVPIQIPNNCAFQGPQGPLNPTVTVNGHTVTLDWTQTIGGTVFYEISILDGNLVLYDNVILPGLSTHVVATGVPSGSYNLRIYGGNECGMTTPNRSFPFTVQ